MIKNTLRLFVAIVFVVSGFVKAIDPKGLSFKLQEYFSPSVLDLPFLGEYVLFLSVLLIGIELLLGMLLLLKIRIEFTLVSLLLLCIFFGFLTFYSAYYGVVTDCGCFGDAIRLTPWMSFWKDIFLLLMIFILLKVHKEPGNKSRFNAALRISDFPKIVFLLAFSLVAFYVIRLGVVHEPIIDFRDYKEGTNLNVVRKKIEMDSPIYETIYSVKDKETGQVIEISEFEYISRNYWKDDKFEIDKGKTKVVLLNKGYRSDVSKFDVRDVEGNDITKDILYAPKVILLFTYKPEEINKESLLRYEQGMEEYREKGFMVYGVSGGGKNFSLIPEGIMDATAIKTIARSNPFVLVLERGKILQKRAARDFF